MVGNHVMKAVIVAIICMAFFNVFFANEEKPLVNYINIQVYGGDTVWTIASRYTSNRDDLREMVYAIKTINGLNHNAFIYSGQTLKVPTSTKFPAELLESSSTQGQQIVLYKK